MKKKFIEEIIRSRNENTGFWEASLYVDNEEVSKVIYSLSPQVNYTQGKNSDRYIYIEFMFTPLKYRNKGYATELMNYLKQTYPDKIIIGSVNKNSEKIFDTVGAISI